MSSSMTAFSLAVGELAAESMTPPVSELHKGCGVLRGDGGPFCQGEES